MSRLIWHRRDLRLHDNELYTDASPIFSLFIFDPAEFSPRPTGIQHGVNGVTHEPHFTRHLLRAVESLRSNLRKLDGELLIRHGNPLEIIPKLARDLNVDEVAYNEVPGYYEYQQSEELKLSLRSKNIHAYTTSSLTLAHPDDLPNLQCSWESLTRPKEKKTKNGKSRKKSPQNKVNEVEDYYFETKSKITDVSPSRFQGMPSIMGDFRRASRAAGPVRRLAGMPSESLIAKAFCGIESGEIPSLEDLILPLTSAPSGSILGLPSALISHIVQSSIDRNSEMQQQSLSDYEDHAMQHLEDFVTKYAALADRSLADVSENDSSKLSVNLALGVLSPRQIYHCVKSHQSKMEKTENQKGDINNYIRDCSWLISHMEMRDYFLFDSFRNGPKSYHTKPHKPKHLDVRPEEWLPFPQGLDAFNRWASGQTNLPLVDAGINELISTGYTSNRVRQNMASVLSKDLKLDWRLGAEWFQFCLSDHCVAANYGNWAYFSGVGGDPKNRHFRTISQAWRYDSEGKFVRKWNKKFDSLKLKDDYRHHSERYEVALRPWDFYDDWGTPIVDPMTQLTWQDKERFTQFGMISL
mmetsp:Transcript_3549/g.7460  ORF Transcript_3549/g.7460 Transcript_3549/m.7460 type:complete len:581 (-) Transcript_3549:47-1789(-)